MVTTSGYDITSRCPGKALHFSDEDVTSGYDMLEWLRQVVTWLRQVVTTSGYDITSRCPGKALHFSDEDVTSGYDMLEWLRQVVTWLRQVVTTSGYDITSRCPGKALHFSDEDVTSGYDMLEWLRQVVTWLRQVVTTSGYDITSRCPGKALHFSDEDVTSGYDTLELPVSRSLISRQNRSSFKFLPTPFWAESCRAAALRNLSFVIRAVKIIKSEFCNLVSHQFPLVLMNQISDTLLKSFCVVTWNFLSLEIEKIMLEFVI